VHNSVRVVAEFLLQHLSLLFVPVGVGVMTHLDVLGQYGARIAIVIVVSTWISLAVTALVLRALMRGHGETPEADASTPHHSTAANTTGTSRSTAAGSTDGTREGAVPKECAHG
jgi:Na+/H+-dicarboxylate symporter